MDVLENSPLAEISISSGFFNTDTLAYPQNAMAAGSKNVFLVNQDAQRTFRGLSAHGTGGRSMFNVANGYASLNDVGATQGIGSIANFINESLIWIGSGEVFYNGAVLFDTTAVANFVASSTLQLSAKVAGPTYNRAFTAGLAVPAAPQVRARTPLIGEPETGLLTGVFSFKIARVRSLTGARSIASVTSAVITCTGQAAQLTFPALASNGQDRWAIFGTKAGFGGTGVHYLIKEINDTDLSTIDSIARSYIIEYNDSDLLPVTAYIDDYPPQAGSFCARIENYVLVFGTYVNAIQASIRNFPESFNPEHLGFLPKAPTAVLPDPQGSYVYVSCDSSVHAVSVVPSTDNPLVIQTVWSDVGVANNHNWCAVQGVVFAFTAKTGAVTMDATGSPSTEFAQPVAKAMRNWNVANTVVMQVPHLNSVMFANGQEAYLFNLQNLKWSSPAQLNDFFPGNIVSGVVTNRTPYVTLLNGSTFTLYEFDNGSTDTLVTIVTPDIQPNFAGRMNILGLKAVFRAANTGAFNFSISTDFSSSFDKTLAHTAGIAGMQTTGQSRWYLPRREAFALTFSGHQTNFSNDAYLSKMMVYGTVEESLAFPDVTPPTPPTGLSITGHTDTTVTISFTPGTDR